MTTIRVLNAVFLVCFSALPASLFAYTPTLVALSFSAPTVVSQDAMQKSVAEAAKEFSSKHQSAVAPDSSSADIQVEQAPSTSAPEAASPPQDASPKEESPSVETSPVMKQPVSPEPSSLPPSGTKKNNWNIQY